MTRAGFDARTMNERSRETFAAIEALASGHADAGVVPLDAVESALPDVATVEELETALAWLAARSIGVVESAAAPIRASENPAFLDQFLATSFALSQLFAAAAGDKVTGSGVFREGLSDDGLRSALVSVAELRQAHEQAEALRGALRTNKLSARKRRELLGAKRTSDERARALLHALPLRDEWVAHLVSVFKRAAEEVEASRPKRNSLRQQESLGMAPDRILGLLTLAREWEARQVAKATLRDVARPDARRRVVTLDLMALETRADELAARALVDTSIPARRRTGPVRQVRPRRVALATRGANGPAAPDAGGGTFADLGRVGEAVIFALMRSRWAAAASSAPERTAALLREVAEEYWTLVPNQAAELKAVFDRNAHAWLQSDLVRGLLWPAQTAYGDALGFDIIGLAESGDDWLCVEVKTTRGPPGTPFELTANEYERARQEGRRYVIARVASLGPERTSIHLWQDPVALVERGALRLAPASFVVSLAT